MSMMTSVNLNFGGRQPMDSPPSGESKPLFTEKELEDFQRFSAFSVWSATQQNSAYNLNLKQTGNLLENPNAYYNPDNKRKEYFKRFESTYYSDDTAQREQNQIATEMGLGDTGTLAYSPYSEGKFRLGTLGYHEASVASNYQGSLLELATTNQNTTWAQSMMFMNTGLLEGSPAMEPIQVSKSMFELGEVEVPVSDQLAVPKEAYIKPDGTPLTLKDFVEATGLKIPDQFMANPEEIVTPDTIVGMSGENQTITASDAMPNVETTESSGLQSLLRNEFEESFFQYNVGAVNNWERFGRVGNYGMADRTSLGIFDLSVIPVFDAIEAYVSPETTNPAWIALHRSNKINGSELVKELQERDPVLYQAWTEEGINWDTLKQAQNAGEFRAHVNSVFMNNAIQRAISTYEKRNPYFSYVRAGSEMAYSTLVAGDAVAQTTILVATSGASGAISLGLAARTGLMARRGVQVSRAVIRSNLRTLRNIQRTMGNATRFLPINLPGTLLEISAARLGTTLPQVAAFHASIKGANILARGSLWAGGQGIEGFVEEGVTDLLNQGYESALGMRSGLDFGQTLSSAIEGFFAEPLLGAALGPLNFVTSQITNSPGALVANTGRLMGFKGNRVREINAYLSTFDLNWDDMSPLEQELRMEQVARGLVFEESFGAFVDGKLAKAETAHPILSQLGTDIGRLGSRVDPTTAIEAGILIGEELRKFNADVRNNKLSDEQRSLFLQAVAEGVFRVDEDGTIKLNEDLAEIVLGLAVLGASNGGQTPLKQAFIQEKIRQKVIEKVEKENPELAEKLKKENLSKLTKEEQDKLTEEYSAKVEEELTNFNPETIAKLEKQQELLFSLLTRFNETLETQELDSDTVDAFNTAQETFNEAVADRIENIISEINADSAATPVTSEAAPVAPEDAPVAPEDASVAPEDAPMVSEVAPVVSEAAPVASEDAKAAPAIADVDEQLATVSQADIESLREVLKTVDIDADKFFELLSQSGNTIEDAINVILGDGGLASVFSGDDLKNEIKSLITC